MGEYRYEKKDERIRKYSERTGGYMPEDHVAHTILFGDKVVFSGENAEPAQKFTAFLNSLPPEEAKSILEGAHDIGERNQIERMRKQQLIDHSYRPSWPNRRADR